MKYLTLYTRAQKLIIKFIEKPKLELVWTFFPRFVKNPHCGQPPFNRVTCYNLYRLVGVLVMDWQKFFLPTFHHSFPRKRMTRIGLFSLDNLINIFVSVLFIVKLCACGHNTPSALEKNTIEGRSWEHVESCSSTTKIIHNAFKTMPMTCKCDRVVTYPKRLPSIYSRDPWMTRSCEITWQTKTIIFSLPQCLWPPNLVER